MQTKDTGQLAYTVNEACRVLRLGRNTVSGLLASGRLRCVRVGRRIVIPRSAIELFLAEDQK